MPLYLVAAVDTGRKDSDKQFEHHTARMGSAAEILLLRPLRNSNYIELRTASQFDTEAGNHKLADLAMVAVAADPYKVHMDSAVADKYSDHSSAAASDNSDTAAFRSAGSSIAGLVVEAVADLPEAAERN